MAAEAEDVEPLRVAANPYQSFSTAVLSFFVSLRCVALEGPVVHTGL